MLTWPYFERGSAGLEVVSVTQREERHIYFIGSMCMYVCTCPSPMLHMSRGRYAGGRVHIRGQ